MISPQRRNEIVDALRRGTVPQRNLDAFAVGLDAFDAAVGEELASVGAGGAKFKAVRGEYGSGKTFFVRWLQERAKREGFAAAEVQISEAETPLHRLETVYRRLTERLSTADTHQGALRSILDNWFYALEEDVLAEGGVAEGAAAALLAHTTDLMERRLASVARHAPAFATALRAYRRAVAGNDRTTAEALLAWIGGQPNVGAAAKRYAGVKGDLDHFGALSFLQGLLVILRDSGFSGLVVVLDEVETLQRVRSDVREKSLNALRQVIDEIDSGRFPGPLPRDHRDARVLRGTAGGAAAAAPRPAARRGLLRGAPVRQSARPAGAAAQLRPPAAPGCRAEDFAISMPRALPLRRVFWSARMMRT